MARNATPGKEQPLAESVKRGGACLCAHDHSSLQPRVPSHPQGYWLAELVATAIRLYLQSRGGCAHLFSLHYGRRGCLCPAAAEPVAVRAGASRLSSDDPLPAAA